MKKNSIKSLKEWVSKIKRYEYELPKLYEKLEYLKVRSIGYNSPSFEPRISSNRSYSKNSIDYWLQKISCCEERIKKNEDCILNYKEYIEKISGLELIVLTSLYDNNFNIKNTIIETGFKRDRVYYYIKKLVLRLEIKIKNGIVLRETES